MISLPRRIYDFCRKQANLNTGSLTGNKRTVVASTRKTKSRKKRRENDWSDEEAERPNTTSVANRRPTRKRVPRKKQVLDFSSDEDSDFHDDMKGERH